MGTENTETPEVENEETPEVEAPAEGAETPEAPEEAAAEGDVAATEEGTEATGEETGEEGEEEQTDGKGRRRRNGYLRKLERQDRLIEELTNQLATNRQALPPQPPPPNREPTPEEQLEHFLDQRIAAREAMAEQKRQAAELVQKEQEFSSRHEDYGEACNAFTRAGLPPAALQAVLTAGSPPAIVYALAKNPGELARIRALPPVQAILEIGRLDAKLASSTATQKTAQKPVSRKPAPAPISPVTARGPTTVKPIEKMSYEEYAAMRNAQSRKR